MMSSKKIHIFTLYYTSKTPYLSTFTDSIRDFITVSNNKCSGTLSMDVDKDSVQNLDLAHFR